jgi:hypothetical protein
MSKRQRLHRCRGCGKGYTRSSQARACEADHERQEAVR